MALVRRLGAAASDLSSALSASAAVRGARPCELCSLGGAPAPEIENIAGDLHQSDHDRNDAGGDEQRFGPFHQRRAHGRPLTPLVNVDLYVGRLGRLGARLRTVDCRLGGAPGGGDKA